MDQAIRVLHLDDDASERQLVRDALERQASVFHLTQADSREQFESMLANGNVDVALSDFNIFGYEGLEVIEVVRRVCPSLPVIIVTRSGSEEVAVESMKRGAADYVIKTHEHIQRLPSTIWAVLEKKALEDGRKRAEEEIDRIAWLLSTRIPRERETAGQWMPAYGDLTKLNSRREILNAVGQEPLLELGAELMDLMGTSVAVLEKNGDYAAGMLSSGWCRYLDEASRRLCKTGDNARAIQSGKWHCRESCWREACSETIATGKEADTACRGGIRLYVVPIRAGDEAVGAICFGYGDPPADDENLRKIADRFHVDREELRARAAAYHSRPQYVIDFARKCVTSAARLIGEIVERKRAEEALRAQQERAQRYLDIAGVVFVALDTEGKVTLLNRRGEELLGYSASELIGKNWFDTCLPARHRESVRTVFQQLIAGHIGAVEYYENSVLTKSGEERVVAWHNTLVRDKTGGVLGTLSSGEDITERKQAEGALRRSEARYQDYYDNAPDMAVSVSAETAQILDCNQTVANALGYTKQDIIGRPIFDMYHPDCMEDVEKSFQSFVETGEVHNAELQLRARDGSKIDASLNVTAVRDEDGNIVRSRSVWRDITDRKWADRALLESEQRFRAIFEQAAVGVAQIETQTGRFVRVNQRYCQIVGLEPEEMTTTTFMAITYPDDLQEDLDSVEKLKSGQIRDFTMEKRYFRKDGSIVWVNLTVSPMWDIGEEPTYHIAVVEDITSRKHAEAETRKAQRELLDLQRRETEQVEAELEKAREELVRQTRLAAIGQVSASIAHELRNPLGSVRNAVYYLKRHTPKDDATVAEFLDVIDDEVSASDRIIGNLLEMTRAKAATKQVFDLAELVNDVFSKAKDAEQISCRIELAPDPFEVHADPYQLRQVIVNLVDNAVQAMGGQGQLHVNVARSDDYDVISFCDTGPGIPPDVHESLFEPLVTTKAKGVGLGLTICRQIVEGHGGTIDVVDHEGGGAAFRVRLPR